MKITETPPAPTKDELAKYFFGHGKCGQHARKNKDTGEIELWWTADEGHWGRAHQSHFVCKPRLA